jgi:MOSC domain-containing protein YiiM
MGLENPVDRGFRYEVALGICEPDRQFARTQLRFIQGQLNDLLTDGVYARVTTPGTIRPGDAITLISNLQREPLAARTQQPTIN